MVFFITFTTVVHALLFTYDEYVLNKKRDLSQKEINSALIDGVLYLSIVALTIFTTFTNTLGGIYIFLSALSCLSIIKNEFIYPKLEKTERVIHAALYVLHPLILFAFYTSWKMNFFATNLTYWMLQLGYLVLGFKAITYHVIYWNYIHPKKKKSLQ